MCLVVFQKIFRKIFSGVWKMLQGKRQNQKNKHSTQIDAQRSTGFNGAVLRELQSDDRAVDRDLAKHRADCDRREGEFAISDRDRRRWCLRTVLTGAWCVRTARTGFSLSRSRSLSLSLSLRNSFEVKIGTEIHFRSQSLFFFCQRKSISGK